MKLKINIGKDLLGYGNIYVITRPNDDDLSTACHIEDFLEDFGGQIYVEFDPDNQ